MEFVPVLILAVMVKKILDWLRVLVPDDIEAKVMIPLAWLVGIGVALLFSASDELASGITIWGEHTLATADIALVVVYGFAVGSGGGIIHDAVKPNTPPYDGN